MSPNDIQWWSLVVGLCLFVTVVAVAFVLRRIRERRHGPPMSRGEFVINRGPATPVAASAEARSTPRRRPPTAPPPPGEPHELASAVRSAILRAVAERAPAGWTALVLAPPPHSERMTWHVHLAPDVALDLRDGRTVSAAAPAPTHDWQVAGGRTVDVADGDPAPPPGDETVAIRVTGPYLMVVVTSEVGSAPQLVARVVLTGDDELPQPRARATDPRAVQGALREAIELCVGSRIAGQLPTAGYPLPSWGAHERIWLSINR